MTSQELRERAVRASDEAEAILAAAEGEDRVLTEDEQAKFDGLLEERKTLQTRADHADELERGKSALAASNGRRVPPEQVLDGWSPLKITNVHDRIKDDPRHGFANFGEFICTAANVLRDHAPMDQRFLIGAAVTGMSQGSGSGGGFLVPPEFATTIWDGVRAAEDNLIARTDQFTVTGDLLKLPASAETSRATGSRFGGARGYWLAEAAQMTNSNPTLRDVTLEPQLVGVMIPITNKLLNNAGPALGQYVTRAATGEINFLVGDAIMAGDGVGKPTGVIGHAATIDVAAETGQLLETITATNIDDMWSRCWAPSRANAIWFINQDAEPQLQQMEQPGGAGSVALYRPPGGLADSPNATLKGRPVLISEYCKTLGTSGDIVLADFMAYATGLRGGIDSAVSPHLRFDYNESMFRFLFEIDGQPWLASAITPFNGTNTLSPMVTLATRA